MKLKSLLKDIACGTCVLQGYCPYADSIIEARNCFGCGRDGFVTIENPELQSLIDTSKSIIKSVTEYQTFCRTTSTCKTVNDFNKLKEHYESVISKL